jgi:DNA ligase-1
MRRLEYRQGSSEKFWEVEVDGSIVVTRWGRIGTKGQEKRKEHASPAKAAADADKQHDRKVAKGYAPVGSDGAGGVDPSRGEAPGEPKTDLADGEEHVFHSASGRSYTLSNTGGVYACTCPAWRHQSLPIDRRTCKHLRAFRGEAAEEARLGRLPERAVRSRSRKTGAPAVLLAEVWDRSLHDPTGWWMSEKLDGVRAWWDGQTFLSRQGNRYLAPDWFTEALPDHPLDGELFGGRGGFQTTVGIARRADRSDRWRELSFVVFDVPELDAGFEDRLAHAHALTLGEHARVLQHDRCEGIEHLERVLRRVEGVGGEGLMLREPGSRYVNGRSTSLLKVKTFFDAEATVVGHLPGTGKHRGRLGALQVELADGTRFKVGTGFTDAQRENPPEIGTVVTFRYQELTRAGVPRFPSFLRERPDT